MVLAMPRLTQPDVQLAPGHFETGRWPGVKPQHVSQPRLCPSCGKLMRALSETAIYECKACRVFATEPG
jgi:predicted  nucleic acid-binding Zn ribbon protein